MVAFGVAFANLLPPPRVAQVFSLIQLVAAASAVASVVQLVSGSGLVVDGVTRPSGMMAHPNSAALVYSIALAITLVRLGERRRRALTLAVAALLFAGLLATGSVGGFATFIVMIVAFALFSPQIGVGAKAVFILLAVSAVLVFVLSPIGGERLAAFTNIDFSGQSGERNSLEWRIGRWRELLEYWAANPVFGIGYGQSTSGELLAGGYPPHNEYVRILVDTGLVGMATAAILAVIVLQQLASRARLHPSKDMRVAAALTFGVFVGLLVNSITENTFTYSVPMYVLGALLGTVFAAKLEPPISINRRAGGFGAKRPYSTFEQS